MRILPLFPLKIVVFPGEKLNLHIFEERYKQLINECNQDRSTFGILPFIDEKVKDIATEMRLLKIQKTYDGGEMDIVVQGIGLVRVLDFEKEIDSKLYPGGKVTNIPYTYDPDEELNTLIHVKLEELFKLMALRRPPFDPGEQIKTYDYGHNIGLKLEEEYEFLEIFEEMERQHYVLNHLDRILPILEAIQKTKERAKQNGHFHNLDHPDLK